MNRPLINVPMIAPTPNIPSTKPAWLMVECKSMDVTITDAVVHQVLRYNMAIPVRYMVVTNGTASWFFEKKSGSLEQIHELPEWKES